MLVRQQRWLAFLALLAALHASVLAATLPAWAQPRGSAQAPQDLIARGRTLFEDQQYEESVQTLSAALLRPSNTKPQKIEIYRLLALNYITLNRKDEAESAVRGLLSLEPEYALPESESPRFRDFFGAVRQKWDAEGRPGLVRESETTAAVAMQHNSPSQAEPKTQIDLTARITDPQHRVTEVKLFFRTGSRGKFEEVDAQIDGGSVRATIPPDAVRPPLVEYYLQGFDNGGLPVISRGDAGAPLRVAVPEPNKGWILPLALGGGAVVAAAGIVGGILLFGKSSGGNPGKPTPPGTANVSVTIGQ